MSYLFRGGKPEDEEDFVNDDELYGGYYVDNDGEAISAENFQGELYGGYNKVGKASSKTGQEDREGYDSFTIYESSVGYSGSRLISKTPFSAAGKAATRIFKETDDESINFVLRKTTLNSSHKFYAYDAEVQELNPPLKIKLQGPNGTVTKIVKKKVSVKKAEVPEELLAIHKANKAKRAKRSPEAIAAAKEKKEAAKEKKAAKKPAAKKTAAKKPATKKTSTKKSSEDAEIARIEKENKKIEAEIKKAKTQIKKTADNVEKKKAKAAKAKAELKELKAENKALGKGVKGTTKKTSEDAEIARIEKENKKIEAEIKKAKAQIKKTADNVEKKKAKAAKAKAELKELKAENKVLGKKPSKKGGSGSCGMYY